jgi:hypothetical protein
MVIVFEANFARLTSSRVYASTVSLPPPPQDSLPVRAGSPFTGQDSHLLDNERSFMESSHLPFLLDQQCLVAPCFLGAREVQDSGGLAARIEEHVAADDPCWVGRAGAQGTLHRVPREQRFELRQHLDSKAGQ